MAAEWENAQDNENKATVKIPVAKRKKKKGQAPESEIERTEHVSSQSICQDTHSSTTSLPKEVKGRTVKVSKTTRFKFDHKHGAQSFKAVKTKSSEKDMAKFLLEKARQANLLQEQARARRLSAASKSVQRKEFVLPTQSSRSSRVIKPNKKFLGDESVILSGVKKVKTEEESPQSSPVANKPRFSLDQSKSPLRAALSSPLQFPELPSVGLLERPLIVDGKRDRKPSLKLQLSDEESFSSISNISPLRSPLAAPKLGTGLFQQTQFQKASQQHMLSLGSVRKQGSSIVQKAKLQLNRAALNKSKAALARSLKAEIKRQAKYEQSNLEQEEQKKSM